MTSREAGRQARRTGGRVALADPMLSETLRALEVALARRDQAAVGGGLEDLIADDFLEIGASGRRWDRTAVVQLPSEPAVGEVALDGFAIEVLAPDVVLATYQTTSSTPGGMPLTVWRSSVWVRRDGRWQLRYHQGTPMPAEAARATRRPAGDARQRPR